MAIALSACSINPAHKANLSSKKPVIAEIKTETKFKAGKKFGPASERVVRSALESVPRGGGRAVVGKPYKINGRWYKPKHQPNYNKVGVASWYGPNFHGRKTANGEIYDQTALSAAHPTLPLPSYVRVTSLSNNRSVIVRVNDRGPFVKNRLIDLSYRTAELLGTRAGGLAKVKVQYIGSAPVDGKDEKYLLASYKGPGSTHDSKIAARKKLLTYAGIKGTDEELTQIASAQYDNDHIKNKPVSQDQIHIARSPAPSQSLAAFTGKQDSNIFIPASFKAPISVKSNQENVGLPLILSPRNPVAAPTPQPLPTFAPRPIKAGINAYWPSNEQSSRITRVFDNLALAIDNPVQFEQKRMIEVATLQDREKIENLKNELARFGDVLLEADDEAEPNVVQIKVETRLPFALEAIKNLSPTAHIVE